jgi:hypothetical protein
LSLPLAFSQLERLRIWQVALWPMRSLAIRYRCSSLFLCLVASYSLGQTERTGFCHGEPGSEVGRFDQAKLQASRSAIDSETAFTPAGILRGRILFNLGAVLAENSHLTPSKRVSARITSTETCVPDAYYFSQFSFSAGSSDPMPAIPASRTTCLSRFTRQRSVI